MKIRRAKLSDADRIYDIGKGEFERTSWGKWFNKKTLKNIILEEPKHCWVLEINNKIEGARFVRHEWGEVLWGWLIIISEPYRKKGYATLLFEYTNKILRREGYEKIFSEVAMDDTASINWHKKMGKRKIGIFRDWLGKGKDAIIFSMDL